jgi:DNA gyrase subunit A
MRLPPDDEIVGMGIAYPGSYVLTVTTAGYGKLTPVEMYRKQKRLGKGVRGIKIVEKTGELADARIVTLAHQLIVVSAGGQVTRTTVKEIRVVGRSSQGVILMRLDPGDHVVSVATIVQE